MATSNYASIPWDEVAARRGNVKASVLRGLRGKESARKLARALETDYRVFL